MDPVNRKETFLSLIAGGSAEKLTPITREEQYLAAIGGQDVTPPDPITRIEHLLAAIAGISGAQKITPITRIEYYLAALGGQNVTVPDPITREEHFLKAIIDGGGSGAEVVTVTGASPLSLPNAIARAIKSLLQYGKVEQNGTPTPSAPVDIVCNNGAVKWDSVNERIIADGTPEVLRVGGKNLFNVAISSNKSITGKGQIVNTTGRSATEKGVPIIGGKDYVLSYADSFNNGAFFYDANDEFISYLTWGKPPRAFTTPSDARFVRFSFYNATPPTDVQLELGSTATEYEPYITPQIASVQNLFQVGEYEDTQDIISGEVTRRVGVKVLNGTEDWFVSTTLLSKMYNLSLPDLYAEKASVASGRQSPYCTHFARSTDWVSATLRNGKIQAMKKNDGTQSVIGLGYRAVSEETLADFKSWLAEQYAAGTPVIVLYPLADATAEQVSPQPLTLNNGNNTLSATSEVDGIEFAAEYYAES